MDGSTGRFRRTAGTQRCDHGERVHDIEQKLRCWDCLLYYPHVVRDVAWLLDQLAERDARIAELEVRLQRNERMFSLP